MIFCTFITLIAHGVCFLALKYKIDIVFYLVIFVAGFFSVATVPVGYELGVELTYPIGQFFKIINYFLLFILVILIRF